jgi:membrane-bound ClpP family serine protease
MFLTPARRHLKFGRFRPHWPESIMRCLPAPSGIRAGAFVGGLLLGLVGCAVAAAEAVDAVVVPVRLPIVGTRDTQVEAVVVKALERLRGDAGRRGVLVLRFDVGADEPAANSDFGRAVSLARFLASDRLAGVKTVAWLPDGVTGHAVLAALACEEIAMPADATFGPANAAEPAVDDAMRIAYAQIAGRRRAVPAAVAVAFVDPAARVVRVATDAGERFVNRADLEAVRREAAVLEVDDLQPTPLALSGRRARELGFVRLLASGPADLARGLGIPEGALAADPSLDGGWQAAIVPLAGPITAATADRARTAIARAVAQGANLVCLRIDSAGGSPEQSLALAQALAALDPAHVRTVAYVPREARGDAALVAVACDELVMHPAAVLGGEGAAAISPRQGEAIAEAWQSGVARKRGRSWSLPVALAVPGVAVSRAVEKVTGRKGAFCPAELEQLPNRDAWEVGGPIGEGPIQLSGAAAEELRLATHVVKDLAGLRQVYGLAADPALAEPGWAERLLQALASPELAWLLLLIGGAGLYIELKTPGVGLGGFVSMVAFIIYFWSQHLHGTSGWLEVMLFLAGLFCVAAEIFVLPGFGVLGLGGGLLVIASLVLASQSFVLPENDYQIRQMQWSLLGVLGAAGGVALVGFLLRNWLPATPVLRDVLLVPPTAGEPAGDDELDGLLGAEGTTTSRLAPAGKARIAGAVRDVTSDGELIEPGVRVRVADVRGGRLHVRPL